MHNETERFRPRRHWGQNFLINPGAIETIVSAFAPQQDDRVIEVGPGHGALTEAIVSRVGRLLAVEVDPALAGALEERLDRFRAGGQLEIVEGDVLALGLGPLLRRLDTTGRPARLIGNLPYNIATEVILSGLRHAPMLADLHVMVQREVAERMTSEPGRKSYGSLSVLCQTYARIERVLRLRPGSFKPRPRVESQMIRLVPHSIDGHLPPFGDLSVLLRAAFEQRRRTLLNNLSRIAPGGSDGAGRWIRSADLDPRARPEAIPVEGYLALLRHRPAV